MIDVHIAKWELLSALKTIKPLTANESSKPILSHALLTAQKNGREISESRSLARRAWCARESGAPADHVGLLATDYEFTLALRVPAQVNSPGQILLPVKRTLDMLKDAPDVPIWIREIDHGWFAVEAGATKIKLPGVDVGLYPNCLEGPQPFQWTMEGAGMCRAICLTLPAISQFDTRQNLRGVHISQTDGLARFEATDGHRLAVVERPVDTGRSKSKSAIVPHQALEIWRAALAWRKPSAVAVHFDDLRFTFTVPDMILTGRLIEGKFPNLDPIIPRDCETHLESEIRTFKTALKSIAAASSEKVKPVKLTINGNVLMESERAEYGQVAREVEAETTGPDLAIGMNVAYLLDLLNVLPAKARVRASFRGPLHPTMWETEAEPGYFAVVMPLQVEW